jgi:hypothetical protein
MIDYIMGGEYLTVTSNKGAQPYINKGSGQPMIGAVSYDSNSQSMKVYDGSTWMTVGGGSATVNLTPNAISVFKWAERKMQEEYELKALADSNPTIKDLVDQMNNSVLDYQRKIAMVKTLIKEEEKIVTS